METERQEEGGHETRAAATNIGNETMLDRLRLRRLLYLCLAFVVGLHISGCAPVRALCASRDSTELAAQVEYAVTYHRGEYVDGSSSVVVSFRDDTPLASEPSVSLLGWVPAWNRYALGKHDGLLSWDPRTGSVVSVARLSELDTVSGWYLKETYSAAISADGSTMVVSYGPELGPYYIFDLDRKAIKTVLSSETVKRITGAGSDGSTIVSGRVLNRDGTLLALTLPSPDDVPNEYDGLIDAETYVIDVPKAKATRIARGCYPVGFLDHGELVCMREDLQRGRLHQEVLVYDMNGVVRARMSGVMDASTDGEHILTIRRPSGASETGVIVSLWTGDLKRLLGQYRIMSDLKTRAVHGIVLATVKPTR